MHIKRNKSKWSQDALLSADEVGHKLERKAEFIGFVTSLAADNPLRQPSLDIYGQIVDIEHRIAVLTAEFDECFSSKSAAIRHPLRSAFMLRRIPELVDWGKRAPSELALGYTALAALGQVSEDVRDCQILCVNSPDLLASRRADEPAVIGS